MGYTIVGHLKVYGIVMVFFFTSTPMHTGIGHVYADSVHLCKSQFGSLVVMLNKKQITFHIVVGYGSVWCEVVNHLISKWLEEVLIVTTICDKRVETMSLDCMFYSCKGLECEAVCS